MASRRTDRMSRSERLYWRLADLDLKRAELEAQIKVIGDAYRDALQDVEGVRRREEKSHGA